MYREQRHALVALPLLLSYVRDTLSVRTETFPARIGASNARKIVPSYPLSFNAIHTVALFDGVEMQFVDPGVMSWPGGQVREYP